MYKNYKNIDCGIQVDAKNEQKVTIRCSPTVRPWYFQKRMQRENFSSCNRVAGSV